MHIYNIKIEEYSFPIINIDKKGFGNIKWKE